MEESKTKRPFWRAVWARHVAIVMGIFLMLAVGAFVFRRIARNTGNTMSGPLSQELRIDDSKSDRLADGQLGQLKLLIELFDFIKTRRDHNKAVFMKMYEYHFASTTILLAFSSISTILLLIVAQQGIANSKPYFKTTFFTVALITTFYAVAPQVYDYEKNIETNLELYKSYEQLRYDIYLHAIVMQQDPDSEQLLDFPEFYAGVLQTMRELINVGVKFDSESIKVPDFGDQQGF